MPSPDTDSIKKTSGLASPTIINLQIAGWLVFVCLWLPLCKGCRGGGDKTPLDFLKPIALDDFQFLFGDILILGAYCNGLLIAMAMSLVACFASQRLWQAMFFAQLSITLVASVLLVLVALYQSTDNKNCCETFLYCVPTLSFYTTWVGLAILREDLPRAWARLQHAWTIVALFVVHMLLLFEGSVLFGYWLTLLGQGWLFVAVEIAVFRMKHDLWDVSQKVIKPQFSIRNILIWTAFFPVAMTYFRLIEPICKWLFDR